MADRETNIVTPLAGREAWSKARGPKAPAAPTRATPAPPPPRRPARSFADDVLREGEVLAGKYRVDRLLGAGGMGVVAAATHLVLGSKVALKLLRPEFASLPNAQGRFLREARAASRLRSEHVARVYDVGEREDGTPFMVMEQLEGIDLEAYLLTEGPLAVGQAVGLVLQACEALAEAHALGFIHRDLKPSNLFLTQRAGGEVHLKILDFGVSKELSPDPTLSPDGARTTRRAVVGSPFYMAPEQALGSHAVDGRCDIWALGVILFEALSGRRPFDGGSFAEIAKGLANQEPPWAALPANVPREVRRVLAQCLAKKPDKRVASALALAEALGPFGTADSANPLQQVRHAAARVARRSDPNEPTMLDEDDALAPALAPRPKRLWPPERRWLWLSAGAGAALLPFAFLADPPAAPAAEASPPGEADVASALGPAAPADPPADRAAPAPGPARPSIAFASARAPEPTIGFVPSAAATVSVRPDARAQPARSPSARAPLAPAAQTVAPRSAARPAAESRPDAAPPPGRRVDERGVEDRF